jgi:lipoate synthase
MKSKQLHARLVGLAKTENFLEVIKDSDLSKIKGGADCPNLTSCGTFVDCKPKYKSGDRTVTISPPITLNP